MESKFKTALFGYSKKDVYEYIISVTDELEKRHSDEVAKLEKNHSDEVAELKKQIARLEAENQKVTDIIHDAKLYAEGLKSAAEEEIKALKEKSAAELRMQEKRIAGFTEQTDNLARTVAKFLNNVNNDLAEIKEQCDSIVSKSPDLLNVCED